MTECLTTAADAWRRHPRWGSAPDLDLGPGGLTGLACQRLVVVAAHPDDETLGAAGLIAHAHAAGIVVYVVLLTAGESSTRHGPGLGRHAIATVRLSEIEAAIHVLAPESPVVFLGAADRGVAASEEAIATSLSELVGQGSRTMLVAPWRHDGNADHEAAGRAAAEAARRTGARLAEYPLWAWSQLAPEDLPWDRLSQVALPPDVVETKEWLVAHHRGRRAVAHLTREVEHFVTG